MGKPRTPSHTFTLNGQRFTLNVDDVRNALARAAPDPVQKYWVEIDGVSWPVVKQVLGLATGLPTSAFVSTSAQRLLTRIGFDVMSEESNSRASGTPNRPAARAGDRSTTPSPQRSKPTGSAVADVILISCVKTKLDRGAPARDLYVSPYFKAMRAFAERSGRPWFILSAEHGLVHPDDWLEPYECYLPHMSSSYQREWGQRVARQLAAAIGKLSGQVLEVHAGAAYVDSLRAALQHSPVQVINRLEGLTQGQRLSWYNRQATEAPEITALRDHSRTVDLQTWKESSQAKRRHPGLYTWWVDEPGAVDLTAGLGHEVSAGLIYAGSAGATNRRGATSRNTLWGRVAGMHLGPRQQFSTLRRSLGAILSEGAGRTIPEDALTEWMHRHLQINTADVEDRDRIDELEHQLLQQLNPLLNLRDVPDSPVRQRLRQLRHQ